MKQKEVKSNGAEAKILEAAEKVFAEKGLSGARVKEIADLAEVNPALINYYFDGKEKLYETVIENFFRRVERVFYPLMEQTTDPQEKLKSLIASGIDLLTEKEHMARILMREFVDNGQIANELITKQYLSGLFSTADRSVFAGMSGDKNRFETMHLIFNIMGCMTLFFVCGPLIKEVWKRDIFPKKMIEERKEEVINLVFYGMGGPDK